jgi:hypothetical protein
MQLVSRELNIADKGNMEQIKAIGNLHLLLRP